MPYSTKIFFVPRDNNEAVRNFETMAYYLSPRSAKAREKQTGNIVKEKGLLFRETGNSSYTDYIATLDLDEFKAFHKKHYQKPFHPEKDFHHFLENEIDKVYYRWVIIECYEWDSGYC